MLIPGLKEFKYVFHTMNHYVGPQRGAAQRTHQARTRGVHVLNSCNSALFPVSSGHNPA